VGDENDKWTIFNGGAGLKILLPYPAAFRLEYRYQKFNGDTDVTNHLMLFGISVFIK